MATIFISYSRADYKFVTRFTPLIRRVYGNDCLWFDDDIHGGVDWWQMILDEINKCDLFIYLISNKSLESPYCQAELREALRLKKQILPVIVSRLKPAYPGNIDPRLGAVLYRTQFIDMVEGFKDPNTLAELYAAIKLGLDSVPQHPVTPVTSTPTSEPPVPDKKKPTTAIRAAYIAGIFAILAAVITGIFGLWQGVFAASGTDSPSPPPTTAVALIATDTPSETPAPSNIPTDTPMATWAPSITPALPLLGSSSENPVTGNDQWTPVVQTIDEDQRFAVVASSQHINVRSGPGTSYDSVGVLAPGSEGLIIGENEDASWLNVHLEDGTEVWILATLVNEQFVSTETVLVPAGCFMMGNENDGTDERLVDKICFEKPFWIDKTEVTNAQFGSTGCEEYSSEPKQPRNCVNWFEARDFCAAHGGRLPTEAEWEYAARGPDGLVYPWGNEFIGDNAIWEDSPEYGESKTAPVGSRPDGVSWVGALDMGGNLSEWTSSLYGAYPYDANDGRESDTGDDANVRRVVRDGSFDDYSFNMETTDRSKNNPYVRHVFIGFRCARDYNP